MTIDEIIEAAKLCGPWKTQDGCIRNADGCCPVEAAHAWKPDTIVFDDEVVEDMAELPIIDAADDLDFSDEVNALRKRLLRELVGEGT